MLAGELRPARGIALYSLATRTYRQLTDSGARPTFLPGGREILYGDGVRLRVVNIDTGAVREVPAPMPLTSMSLSADGKTLVYSERRTEADIWMMQ